MGTRWRRCGWRRDAGPLWPGTWGGAWGRSSPAWLALLLLGAAGLGATEADLGGGHRRQLDDPLRGPPGGQQREESASAELEDYIHGLEEGAIGNLSQYKRSRSLHPPASDEKRLTKYLLSNYRKVGRGGRPVSNSSTAVLVKFGLAMIQMGLDEKDNMLTTSVWCRYRWHDEYLTWEPREFGGVHTIRLSSAKIWIPDIMLYNTADTHKMERDVLVVIEHTGEVLWIPHRIYRASCGIDVTNYPFDTQTCDMTFGSWAYHGNEIDLGFYEDMEMLDISDLERESTEWDIISKGENRKSSYYDCCKDPYVTLTFTLSMRRKLVFSSFILTLPCIFLACMTLVVFWLPPERPDRTSLAMSLFASFLLLLLILVEAAPPTASSVPTLGLYYCFNMTLIMLSIFLSSVVININRKGEAMRPVPRWLKALTGNCLPKFLCTLCSKSHASRVKVKEHQPRRRSTRDGGVVDAEDGVITNQEALQVNNSGANARQVEATLTSSNGVQTNVVPASQPLLSRDNSGDEGGGGDKHDLQVTYSNNAGEERKATEVTTTELDNLSSSSAAALLTAENENAPPPLPVLLEDDPLSASINEGSAAGSVSGCVGGASVEGDGSHEGELPVENTVICSDSSARGTSQPPEFRMDPAMYSFLFRSLSDRLAALERHLVSTERGIREVARVLAVKDMSLEQRQLEKEWKFIAFALDRMFFLVFIIAIGVSLGTLFPRPYQLQFN